MRKSLSTKTPKSLKPIKKENLTHKVIDALKKYIINENLKEGDKLPSERELCQILIVSRNVIREAMKSLEAVGIVHKKQGKGVFIGSFKSNLIAKNIMFGLDKYSVDLKELMEVRRAFEMSILKPIINKVIDNDIRDLQLIVNEMRAREEKSLPLVRIDLKFHSRMHKILKNDIIERLGMILVEFFKELSLDRPDTIIKSVSHPEEMIMTKRHQRILDALEERNLEKVTVAMKRHLIVGYVK